MRPTKLLTISAIAGLSLISYGRSAHAAPPPVNVSLTGTVPSFCTLSTTGAINYFSEAGGALPTQLVATGNNGEDRKVTVTCNDASKTLNLNITSSQVPSGTPYIKFSSGATGGIFANVSTPYRTTGVPVTVDLTAPTKASGDTGYVWAKIEQLQGKPLKFGDYNLVVTATITP